MSVLHRVSSGSTVRAGLSPPLSTHIPRRARMPQPGAPTPHLAGARRSQRGQRSAVVVAPGDRLPVPLRRPPAHVADASPPLGIALGVPAEKQVRPGVTPLGPVRNHLRSIPFETRFLAALHKQARHFRNEKVSKSFELRFLTTNGRSVAK